MCVEKKWANFQINSQLSNTQLTPQLGLKRHISTACFFGRREDTEGKMALAWGRRQQSMKESQQLCKIFQEFTRIHKKILFRKQFVWRFMMESSTSIDEAEHCIFRQKQFDFSKCNAVISPWSEQWAWSSWFMLPRNDTARFLCSQTFIFNNARSHDLGLGGTGSGPTCVFAWVLSHVELRWTLHQSREENFRRVPPASSYSSLMERMSLVQQTDIQFYILTEDRCVSLFHKFRTFIPAVLEDGDLLNATGDNQDVHVRLHTNIRSYE